MSTVIDDLIVMLSLNTSQFTAGQRQALDSLRKFEQQALSSGNAAEAKGKKLLDFISKLKSEVIGGVASMFGAAGIKEFIVNLTNLDAATGRYAKTLGVTIGDLSAWQGAFRQTGGTAEGATAALQGLSGEISSFALTGQSSILGVLTQLNVGLVDQNGALKTASQLWLGLAGAVEGMDPRRATAFLSMIPGASQEMINFALLGRRAMEQYIDASRQAGGATRESVEEAQKLQSEWALLSRSAEDAGRRFLVLTGILNGLASTFKLLGDFLHLVAPTSDVFSLSRGQRRRAALAGITGQPTDTSSARQELTDKLRTSGGIPIKPGAGEATALTSQIMSLLSGVSGIREVTSLRDSYHAGGLHAQGRALDATITDPSQSAAVAADIRRRLIAAGISANVIDEYVNPSPRATGGHIHVGVPLGARVVPGATRTSPGHGAVSGDTTTTVHVGNVNVNAPNVTDPNRASAAGIGAAVDRYVSVGMADSGIN